MLESNHYNESDLTTIVIPTGLLHETGLSIAAKMAVIVFLELPQNSTNIPNLLAASMGVSNTTVHKHLRDLGSTQTRENIARLAISYTGIRGLTLFSQTMVCEKDRSANRA